MQDAYRELGGKKGTGGRGVCTDKDNENGREGGGGERDLQRHMKR